MTAVVDEGGGGEVGGHEGGGGEGAVWGSRATRARARAALKPTSPVRAGLPRPRRLTRHIES